MALSKGHFQAFYPGMTLLCCSGKSSVKHLLRDQVEYVSVAGTIFKTPLDAVLPPYVNKAVRFFV